MLSSEGVRFASISKKTPLSKLSFAFVSLALPLLVPDPTSHFPSDLILHANFVAMEEKVFKEKGKKRRREREKNKGHRKGREGKERNIMGIKETGGEGRGGKIIMVRRQKSREGRKENEGKKT